ncbi:MAG: flagellar motor switch protein FliM [Sulfobacillus thermosulfidooxidans]|nr:MAG: flagellar motor switch protein FliM [Sulfobacillus thermosulfidooxidans]
MRLMGLVKDLKEVRPYDFQRPHQLSRLQLDAITLMMESYLRMASNFLSTYLRTPVQIQHISTEQMPYEQYVEGVTIPSVLALFTINQSGSGLLESSPEVTLAIIDRALGGPGFGHFPSRELTEIEQTIYRRIMERLLSLLGQSWSSLMPFEARIDTIEYNPAFTQISSEGDLVVVQQQQISIDSHKGILSWVWPYPAIEPFALMLGRHALGREDDQDVKPKTQEMLKLLSRSSVRADVVLGRTTISLGEFRQLKPGDIIILKNRYDKPLTLSLANQEKFHVVAGKVGGHLAVRVTGRVNPDDQE